MALHLSHHAEQRMPQRGYSAMDIWFVENFGTTTADGIVFTHRNSVEIENRARRLEGTYIPVAQGCAVTVQRLTRKKSKRVRRH